MDFRDPEEFLEDKPSSFSLNSTFFPQNFGDLLNHLQNLPNFIKFHQNYTRNRAYFQTSPEVPDNPPSLVDVQLFWLRMNPTLEKSSTTFLKNNSITKETTFLLWLVSILEEFWRKTLFELVKFRNFLFPYHFYSCRNTKIGPISRKSSHGKALFIRLRFNCPCF